MTDDAFHAALEGRPTDWAIRAIAGYVSRTLCGDAECIEQANRHGLSRAYTAEEQRAWTFGFTWVDRKAN